MRKENRKRLFIKKNKTKNYNEQNAPITKDLRELAIYCTVLSKIKEKNEAIREE